MRPDNDQKMDWRRVSIIFAISLPVAVLIAWELKNPMRGDHSSNEEGDGNMFLIGLVVVELMFVFYALLLVGIYLLKWADIYDASWILGTPVHVSDNPEVEEEQGIQSPLMQHFQGTSNEIQEEENRGVGGSRDKNRAASSSIVRGSEVVGTTNEIEEENRGVGGSMDENGAASSSIVRLAEAVATGVLWLCAPIVTRFFLPNPLNDRDERGAQRRLRNTEQSNRSDVAEDESSAREGRD